MATLTSGISVTDSRIRITTPGSPRIGATYRIGDELVRLETFWKGTYQQTEGYVWKWVPDTTAWRVERGAEQTVALSHDAGTAVDEFVVTDIEGGDGGGLSNPVTEPLVVSPEAADDFDALVTVNAPVGSEGLVANMIRVIGETGEDILRLGAYGSLSLRGASDDPSNGGAELEIRGAGPTYPAVHILRGDNGSGAPEAGFFGASAVGRPEVPASPNAQDIVDALVLLGLVSQAAP
jgi:hypothetical protein